MTEKKTDKSAPIAAELSEEQLDEVQGAGILIPEAAPPASDVRKAGKEQQEY